MRPLIGDPNDTPPTVEGPVLSVEVRPHPTERSACMVEVTLGVVAFRLILTWEFLGQLGRNFVKAAEAAPKIATPPPSPILLGRA